MSKNDIKKDVVQAINWIEQLKVVFSHNLTSKIDLIGISGKSPLENRLVRLIYKFSKSIIETSSKVRESKTYDKAINDFIYMNKQHKVVHEELLNFDIHQTWYHTTLSKNRRVIDCKQIFRIKYSSNGFIKRYKIRLMVQNFFQIYEIDNIKILVITTISLKIFLAIVEMLQMVFI